MSRLSIAGKELIKGNFGNAVAAITQKYMGSGLVQPAVYRNGNFFFGVNGADHAFIWGNYNSSLLAYHLCPIISSVINKQAQCTINGRVYIMDEKGKESNTPQAKALKKLLKHPNRIQSGINFRAQGQVYKRIYGYCPVLVMKPIGYEEDYSKWQLWNIPPWMIKVQDSYDLFYEQGAKQFTNIWLTYMGHSISLNPDNVFWLKDNQISTGTYMSNSTAENVSLFLPDSKLLMLENNIDNLVASLNSRGSIVRNRGPLWVLTNDSSDSGEAGLFPIDKTTKDELHKDFSMYGVMHGQKKAIITDAKLKMQSVGFNVEEMKLLESEIQDAKFICDGLNYPPYLLGLVDAKFDNQQIAERNLYVNCIIPDCESDDEQWSELFGLDEYGLKIETDFSHLAALQENIAETGRGRYYMNTALQIEFLNNQITANRWRELLGEDTIGSDGDKYYYQYLLEGRTFGVVPHVATGIDGSTALNNPNSATNNASGAGDSTKFSLNGKH